MKKLSGMMKLRLAVTVIFLLMIVSFVIGMYVVSVESEADEIFYERLTTEDVDDINRIYLKYPDVESANRILEIAGILVWIAIAALSYLMYKVWHVKEIK